MRQVNQGGAPRRQKAPKHLSVYLLSLLLKYFLSKLALVADFVVLQTFEFRKVLDFLEVSYRLMLMNMAQFQTAFSAGPCPKSCI
ncbi:MAG: hypothetical protein ACI9EH_001209 [Planktomarina sp.]|jgi:hypothetical protein